AGVFAVGRPGGPLARFAADGVKQATSPLEIAEKAAVVMLSLPSGSEVEAVCGGPDGLLARSRKGQVVIDLRTSPIKLMRALAEKIRERGGEFPGAPVARTRAAAEGGAVRVVGGAGGERFRRMEPLLKPFATEVTHCGAVGAGQLTKILNNMVLFETGVALAEALALARRSGLDPALLLATLAKGS